MNHILQFLIVSLLIVLISNIDYIPIALPKEINDGETANLRLMITTVWIYSKIEKSSQIVVEIKSDREIKENDVSYSKYYKETNQTEFTQIKLFATNGDTFTCTYDIDKDTNDYGVLKVKGFSFGDKITVSVKVIPKTTFWIFLIIGGVVLLFIIVGAIVVCKKCLKCC